MLASRDRSRAEVVEFGAQSDVQISFYGNRNVPSLLRLTSKMQGRVPKLVLPTRWSNGVGFVETG